MPKLSAHLPSWAEDLAPLWSRSGMAALLAVGEAGDQGCSTAEVMTATGLGRTSAWEILGRLEDAQLVQGPPERGQRGGWRVVTWRVDQDTKARMLQLLDEHLGAQQ